MDKKDLNVELSSLLEALKKEKDRKKSIKLIVSILQSCIDNPYFLEQNHKLKTRLLQLSLRLEPYLFMEGSSSDYSNLHEFQRCFFPTEKWVSLNGYYKIHDDDSKDFWLREEHAQYWDEIWNTDSELVRRVEEIDLL